MDLYCICPVCGQEIIAKEEIIACPNCKQSFDIHSAKQKNHFNNHIEKKKRDCRNFFLNQQFQDVIYFAEDILKEEPNNMLYRYYLCIASSKNKSSVQKDFLRFQNYTGTDEEINEVFWYLIEQKDRFPLEYLKEFLTFYHADSKYLDILSKDEPEKEKKIEKELKETLFSMIPIINTSTKLSSNKQDGIFFIGIAVVLGLIFWLIGHFFVPKYIIYPSFIFLMIFPCVFLACGITRIVFKRKNKLYQLLFFILLFYIVTFIVTIPYHSSGFFSSLGKHFISIFTSPYDFVKNLIKHIEEIPIE